MERESAHYTPEAPLGRDPIYKTPEQIALEALVDALFEESDKRTFEILNKILESVRQDGKTT